MSENSTNESLAHTNNKNVVVIFLKTYYPILFVFIGHELALYLSALQLQYSIFNPTDFVRWDSALYIDIAKKGYELIPCKDLFSSYPRDSTEWCGNAGWMPLFPWLIRLFMNFGMHEYTAAYFISKICTFIVYTCLFILLKNKKNSLKIPALILAAVFPSSVYYDAVFPISLMLALILSSYLLWLNNKLIPACIIAFFVPLAYSTGFVYIGVWALMTYLLHIRKSDRFKQTRSIFIACLAGYIFFLLLQQISIGAWNGFFLIQGKYGHGFHNVFKSIGEAVLSLYKSGINHNWQNIQSILFLCLLIYFSKSNYKTEAIETVFIRILFLAFAAFPIIIGSAQLSQFRSESLLLPVILLLSDKKALMYILIPIFIFVFASCTIEFFHGSIT